MILNHKKFVQCVVWLTVAILAAVCMYMPAEAAVYDAGQEGSITIRLEDIGTDVSEVEFYCYLVAEPEEGSEMSWKLIPPFEDADVDINHLKKAGDYREAAEKLASWDRKDEAEHTSGRTDAEGTVSFKALKQGIYLLEQTDQCNYGAVTPFLISIPYTEDGQEYLYDVYTDTKGERTPDETDGGTGGQKRNSDVKSGSPAQTGDQAMPGIYVIAAIASGLGIRKMYKIRLHSDREK